MGSSGQRGAPGVSVLIHGATIVTGDAAETLHFDAAILLEGGRIAAMGPSDALRAAHPAATLVDGRGRLVMPGFANIHTHLHMTLARGGYAAMGVQDAGWLAVGNAADLIMVRADRAHMVPMLRPVSTWLHQGQPSDVTDVMVAGDWVMRDGRILTMDEEAIVAEAQRIGVRAWGKLFAARPELEKPAGFVPL